ncbi:MAG TPA: transglycosylase SLT domain-containing protein [Bryobacteraceae bacterium]|nr:transglycosylase SLT domain-containing protein [Bryobacteraceae bacterium]
MADHTALTAWVIRKSEGLPSTSYPIRGDTVRIGRSAENDIVLSEEPSVSARHLEIRRVDGDYWLHDLDSTNGTYLNGERVQEAALRPPASIQLGTSGPALVFMLEDAAADPDRTLISSTPVAPVKNSGPAAPISAEHEKLVASAVAKARRARSHGAFDQTATIMRSMLGDALQRTTRKFKIVIAGLLVALAGISAYGFWQIGNLKREKRGLDSQMEQIEVLLEKPDQNPAETEQLLDRLDQFQGQAKALEGTLLYRILARQREDPVTRDIRSLMSEFGAETYSVPPEFLDQVNRFIQRYQGPDRATTERALGEARSNMETMREIFQRDNLPPDLAYMVLVESGMNADGSSPAGAVGWWQFTPATAKYYGLRVDSRVDERRNARKSTEAAAKYVRDLILDFGSGSSVMLALAAYNLGPAKVKQAIRRVRDPIRQRDFWYLYRMRALPVETREYVPKVIAAMIIARNPDQFGFK